MKWSLVAFPAALFAQSSDCRFLAFGAAEAELHARAFWSFLFFGCLVALLGLTAALFLLAWVHLKVGVTEAGERAGSSASSSVYPWKADRNSLRQAHCSSERKEVGQVPGACESGLFKKGGQGSTACLRETRKQHQAPLSVPSVQWGGGVRPLCLSIYFPFSPPCIKPATRPPAVSTFGQHALSLHSHPPVPGSQLQCRLLGCFPEETQTLGYDPPALASDRVYRLARNNVHHASSALTDTTVKGRMVDALPPRYDAIRTRKHSEAALPPCPDF